MIKAPPLSATVTAHSSSSSSSLPPLRSLPFLSAMFVWHHSRAAAGALVFLHYWLFATLPQALMAQLGVAEDM